MRASAGLMLVLLSLPASAHPQGRRWETQVRDRLERIVSALPRSSGTRSRVIHIGPLNTEESEWFVVELRAGAPYDFVGTCDEDCSQLHVLLRNPTGSDVAVDRSGESLPRLQFTPRDSGSYRIQVTMAACRLNPCWYGVAVRTP